MSNVGRVLTVRLEIQSDEGSQWIWDNHLKGVFNGIRITGISEGDMFAEVERLEDRLNDEDSR